MHAILQTRTFFALNFASSHICQGTPSLSMDLLSIDGFIYLCFRTSKIPGKNKTRRSVEHCTPHADGAWLNELGWSQ